MNYLAILIASVASMAIGFLWYSSALFGNTWIKLSGITKADIEKTKKNGMNQMYGAGMIASFVMNYVLAHFVAVLKVTDISSALMLAIWIWIGFVATVMLNSILYEGKPVKLYLINVSYQLVSLLVASIILGLWR